MKFDGNLVFNVCPEPKSMIETDPAFAMKRTGSTRILPTAACPRGEVVRSRNGSAEVAHECLVPDERDLERRNTGRPRPQEFAGVGLELQQAVADIAGDIQSAIVRRDREAAGNILFVVLKHRQGNKSPVMIRDVRPVDGESADAKPSPVETNSLRPSGENVRPVRPISTAGAFVPSPVAVSEIFCSTFRVAGLMITRACCLPAVTSSR